MDYSGRATHRTCIGVAQYDELSISDLWALLYRFPTGHDAGRAAECSDDGSAEGRGTVPGQTRGRLCW